jgi:hypothetical protein
MLQADIIEQMPPEKMVEIAEDVFYRQKEYIIPARWLMNLLYGQQGPPRYVDIPEAIYPPDAIVLQVGICRYKQGISVIVCHPSFDKINEGNYPPVANAGCQWTRYGLATEQELRERQEELVEEWAGYDRPGENGCEPGEPSPVW